MKAELPDISLKELRDFVVLMDTQYAAGLSGMSYVSLKLRLQFILSENNFNGFAPFFKHISTNEIFRDQVLSTIKWQATELFRDATQWKSLRCLSEKLHAPPLTICLFESGRFAETATLLFFLLHWKILHSTTVTLVDVLAKRTLPPVLRFSHSQIEAARNNFSGECEEPIRELFVKKDKQYEFRIPVDIQLQYVPLAEIASVQHTSDILIARNITPAYNFTAHEELFGLYSGLLKEGGIFFAGNNESFNWCKGFGSFSIHDTNTPFYIKR